MPTEEQWLKALQHLPAWQPPALPTLVIAPHPDDETLGAGGLIATQVRRGIPVRVVAVTDGEAALPDWPGLGEVRRQEQEAALAELGVPASNVIRLCLPDGKVSSSENRVAESIEQLIDGPTLLAAPWALDAHPDHEACGRAAARVAKALGSLLVSYFFWAWHYKTIDSVLSLPLRRLEIEARIQAARHRALSCHRSQLTPANGNTVLSSATLRPAQRCFETFAIS